MVLDIFYYLRHAAESRAILQWKLFYEPVYGQNAIRAEEHDVKECWRFMALTSRSFVGVTQQLHPRLLMPVCIFYLVLRGLDTIEDDMTICIEAKESLLRDFHKHLPDESWTFDQSGPDEHDRELLVRFDCVAREYNKLDDDYCSIIKDITRRMGNGMADYALNANIAGVNTVKEYELYCHYVAGLVGEGVSRMFILAGLADPVVLEKPELSESMAQLLQQTNIIRDVHEDHEQNRHFWPKDIWSKHVDRFDDLFLQDTRSRMKALECSSEMVLLAINRAQECLAYMANVREQSTFNFVAIPQCMAIATLELCFRNPEIFERNVKITKGLACQLLIESTKDIRHVGRVFQRFARKIQDRNEPDDPNHDNINAACEKICRTVDNLVSDYRIPWLDSSVALSSKGRYIAVWSGVLALGFLTVFAVGSTSLR